MSYDRIGEYLLRAMTGGPARLDEALVEQERQERAGASKRLGQILLENGDIDPAALDRCLGQQRLDVLSSLPVFNGLSADALAEIASVAVHLTCPDSRTVVRKGDPGDSFYCIVSGSVRVSQTAEDGTDISLGILGPGEAFGEIALLTGQPRAASVATLAKTTFVVVSKTAFDRVVAANPEISGSVVRTLAGWLEKGNTRIVEAAATERAYRRFVSEYAGRREPELVGTSALTRNLRSGIERVAAGHGPVLVTGEPGTEMWDVAGLIHRSSENREGLFLTMDAKAVSLGDERGIAPGEGVEGDLVRELTQSASLFGHGRGVIPSVGESRLGLLQIGDRGTVLIENVERLARPVQEQLATYLEQGRFVPLGSENPLASRVRIVASTSENLETLAEQDLFEKKLWKLLGEQVLAVPPLRRRKKDLEAIVERLVARFGAAAGKRVTGIEEDVYRSFMAYDWPGNTDELNAVVRRAVSLTTGERLSPADVFIPAPAVTGKITYNLLKQETFRQVFTDPRYRKVGTLAAAAALGLVFLSGVFGPSSSDRNLALVLTWGLWEPLVIAGAVLVPRIWCSVCPIGAFGEALSRGPGLGRKVPLFLRKYGVFFGTAGVCVIFWSESAAHMIGSPLATALLVGAIALLAGVAGMIFERRAWCRYLCPLGGMIGAVSSCSPVELRANYAVCTSTCTGHECYAGCEKGPGCPVFEGPFSLRSNQQCILCGNCLRACPHDSPVVNLRLPAYELWNVARPEQAVVFFTLALFATQLFRGIEKAGGFRWAQDGHASWWLTSLLLMACVSAVGVAVVKLWGGMLFVEAEGGEAPDRTGLMAYSLLPLVVVFEVGFQLERFLGMGGQVLAVAGRQTGLGAGGAAIAVSPATIDILQLLLVLIGTTASLVLAKTLVIRHGPKPSKEVSLAERWPVLLAGFAYGWILLAG